MEPGRWCRICHTWSEWWCWFCRRIGRLRKLACIWPEGIPLPFLLLFFLCVQGRLARIRIIRSESLKIVLWKYGKNVFELNVFILVGRRNRQPRRGRCRRRHLFLSKIFLTFSLKIYFLNSFLYYICEVVSPVFVACIKPLAGSHTPLYAAHLSQ